MSLKDYHQQCADRKAGLEAAQAAVADVKTYLDRFYSPSSPDVAHGLQMMYDMVQSRLKQEIEHSQMSIDLLNK